MGTTYSSVRNNNENIRLKIQKNITDNVLKEKTQQKNLEIENKNHIDFEKKLNIYSDFYDKYNDRLSNNIDDLTNKRKNIYESYYKNVNLHKHMETKLSNKKKNLLFIIVIFLFLLLGTILFAKMVFS